MTSGARTPCTAVEAAEAFWYAHQDVIGGPCPVDLLVGLVCIWDVETAGGTACYGHNFGNLRGHGTAGTQSIAGADEIIGGKRVTGAAVEAGFAAYATRRDGAAAVIRFLGTASHPPTPNRFAGAWDALQTCDLEHYAHQAGRYVQGTGAYFTADPAVYAKGLRSREPRARKAVQAFLAGLQVPP